MLLSQYRNTCGRSLVVTLAGEVWETPRNVRAPQSEPLPEPLRRTHLCKSYSKAPLLPMACPRCTLRLLRSSRQISIPRRRAFHTSPRHQRLGAALYSQEWQTGTYHYNKATAKTLPLVTRHTDTLLQAYATMRAPMQHSKGTLVRTAIAAQRRSTEKMYVTRSMAKDFGDRMVVDAYVFDGKASAEREEAAKRKARMGVRPSGGGEGGNQPRRRRGGPGAGGGGGGSGSTGVRRMGYRRGPGGGYPSHLGFKTFRPGAPREGSDGKTPRPNGTRPDTTRP